MDEKDELSEQLDQWEQNYVLHLVVEHGAFYEQAREHAARVRERMEYRIRYEDPDLIIRITRFW